MKVAKPEYIGDAIYMSVIPCIGFALTTGHHDPDKAEQVIVIEMPQAEAIIKYIEKIKREGIE